MAAPDMPEVVASVDELAADALTAMRRLERGMLLEKLENEESRFTNHCFSAVHACASMLERYVDEWGRAT